MEIYKKYCNIFTEDIIFLFEFRVTMVGMVIPIQIEGGRSPPAKSGQPTR